MCAKSNISHCKFVKYEDEHGKMHVFFVDKKKWNVFVSKFYICFCERRNIWKRQFYIIFHLEIFFMFYFIEILCLSLTLLMVLWIYCWKKRKILKLSASFEIKSSFVETLSLSFRKFFRWVSRFTSAKSQDSLSLNIKKFCRQFVES